MTSDDPADDVWNYLVTLKSATLPSRLDRDQKMRSGTAGGDGDLRLKLWDYFFPVDLERMIAGPRAESERATAELRGFLLRSDQALAHARQELHDRTQELAHHRATQSERQSRLAAEILSKLRRRAVAKLFWGGSALALAVWLRAATAERGDLLSLAFVSLKHVVAVPVGVAAILLLGFGLRGLLNRTLHRAAVKKGQAQLVADGTAKEKSLSVALAEVDSRVGRLESERQCQEPILTDHARSLQARLVRLRCQQPSQVEARQVEEWFRSDLQRLKAEALEVAQVKDEKQLPELLNGPNPIFLWAPAEIQNPDPLPESYKTKGSDKQKHLWCHRVGIDGNGNYYEHHGVYVLQFFVLTRDKITAYAIWFDFIDGRRIGSDVRIFHYSDVTAISSIERLRAVGAAGEEVEVPILRLSVPGNSESIELAYVSDDYLRLVGSASPGSVPRYYDPAQAVDSARRNIAHFVDLAKKRREVKSE